MAMQEEPMLGGVELLEEKELQGFLSQEEYTELLAAYISQNELQLALFLWRRIPSHLKKESSDLTAIWEVGKSLFRMEYSLALAALNRDWSDKMKPVVETIRTSINNYVFTAVEKAYSCISVKSLAALLGKLEDEVLQESLKRGWTADDDPSYLKPVQPVLIEDPNAEDDFVKTMIRQTKFFENTLTE